MTQQYASRAARYSSKDAPDDYPTPPWATRALIAQLQQCAAWMAYEDHTVWEPAAGRGHMVRALREHYRTVFGSDKYEYPKAQFLRTAESPPTQFDFLDSASHAAEDCRPDLIITNPPFKDAASFILRALDTAARGVAILARLQLLEGVSRWNSIYCARPPTFVMPFAERVPMHQGKLTATGSTATAYAWFVWDRPPRWSAPRIEWIPPCRKQLEKESDYE